MNTAKKATKPPSMRMVTMFATKSLSLMNAQKDISWDTSEPDHIAIRKVEHAHHKLSFKMMVSVPIAIQMMVNIILDKEDVSAADLNNVQMVDGRNTSKLTAEDIAVARDLQLFKNYAVLPMIHGNMSTFMVTQPFQQKTEEKLPILHTQSRLWNTLETVPTEKAQVIPALAT